MNIKNNKGITLIILIVTIMILLIILSIPIMNMVENGTIKKAQNTVNNYNNMVNTANDYEENVVKENIVDFKVEN